jgi:hypothetical protein
MAVWIGWFLGTALHVALRAQNILRSPKNACNSVGEFAHRYGLEVIARVLAGAAGLHLWAYSAETVNAVFSYAHLPKLPLIWGTAFGYGLAIDILLDSVGERYPFLRRVFRGEGADDNKD